MSITVRDHGIGIPADEQRAIFDRFVRGAESKSRRIHGTGIGLAMVRQIVLAHGGEVTSSASPDEAAHSRCGCPSSRSRSHERAAAPEGASQTQVAKS